MTSLWRYHFALLKARPWLAERKESWVSSTEGFNQDMLALYSEMGVTALSTVQHEGLKIGAGTFSQQHGWVFSGPCHPCPWAHGPLILEPLLLCTVLWDRKWHTHTCKMWKATLLGLLMTRKSLPLASRRFCCSSMILWVIDRQWSVQ